MTTAKERKGLSDQRNIDIVKVMLVKDIGSPYRAKQIRRPEDPASIAKNFLAGEDREVFITLSLDHSKKINSIHVVAIGSASAAIVHPREVFKTAILSNASFIILAHNHPSGNPEPSPEDINITRQLFECGDLLRIEVLDHIIIGDDKYTTFMKLEGKNLYWHSWKFKKNLKDSGQSCSGGEYRRPPFKPPAAEGVVGRRRYVHRPRRFGATSGSLGHL